MVHLGIVSILGTGSPTLPGCKEKEVGASHVHPLRWASPRSLTAAGFEREGFPASRSVHPHGWFLVFDTTGFIICSAFALPAEDGEVA